jgi:outer membrane immunogenic protein
MRIVWRGSGTCWLARSILAALALVPMSRSALAQSSVGVPMNAATGRSHYDAAEQNQKELIDREVLGAGPGQRGSAADSTSSGAVSGGLGGINSFPTGRLRTSDHDGVSPPNLDRFGYTTHEASAFANVVATIPGTVLGGQVKVSGFAGNSWLSLDLKSNSYAILDPGQFGKAKNESAFVGGSVLWSQQSTYALATLIGMWGETRLTDGVDDVPNVGRYSFDTSGFIGTMTAGHVFNLAGASGPKLDVRGTIGYTQHNGDWFQALHNHKQKYSFSTWTGTGALTLFSNITLHNNALLRPYVQAYVRQEWDYRNRLSVIDDAGAFATFDSDQSHTYGGMDAGVTYTLGNMTFGAALYSEVSGDERTVGGRLGVSWKLGGEPAQPAMPSPPPAPFRWTGLYVGANAGYAWSNVDMTYRGTDSALFAFAPEGGSSTISPKGALAGGQIGYNWQLGGIVVGVEGGWSAPLLKDEALGRFLFEGKDHWIVDVSQIYSVTGRLGIASGNWLPYLKGGFAAAKVDTSMSFPLAAPALSQAKTWHDGWTLGGGVEYLFAKNWTTSIEYNYYAFESKDVSASRTTDPATDRWSVKPDNIQSVTARMNFKLN